MKLKEILHTVSNEIKKGFINLDDWKWPDLDHLKTMGFDFDGDYVMSLENPKIKIYKKKLPEGEFFFVDENKKGIRVFKDFDQIVDYFDKYSQPEIDKQLD